MSHRSVGFGAAARLGSHASHQQRDAVPGRRKLGSAQARRAVTIQDVELLEDLKREGYDLGPGIAGENLTVSDLHVQQLTPGDRLIFENGPTLELTEARRPCFVLDKIHPQLKKDIVGRCGFLARVINTGAFRPGQRITVEFNSA